MIKRQESEASRKIYIAGTIEATIEGDLGEYFKKYGKLLNVIIVRDRHFIIKHKYLKDLSNYPLKIYFTYVVYLT